MTSSDEWSEFGDSLLNPGHLVFAEPEGESRPGAILSWFDADDGTLTGYLQLGISRLRHQDLKRKRLPDLSAQVAVEERAQCIEIAEMRRLGILGGASAKYCS